MFILVQEQLFLKKIIEHTKGKEAWRTHVLAIVSFPELAELYVLEHGGRTLKRGVFPFAVMKNRRKTLRFSARM